MVNGHNTLHFKINRFILVVRPRKILFYAEYIFLSRGIKTFEEIKHLRNLNIDWGFVSFETGTYLKVGLVMI